MMQGITNGIIKRNITFAGLVLSETYHHPWLNLQPHEHEHANINIVTDGYLDETIERSSFSCDRFSALLKPCGAKHSNRYGSKQTQCLIVEFLPEFREYDTHGRALGEVRFSSAGKSRALARQIWTEF